MRFGRAPHNIMHFGKRADEDREEMDSSENKISLRYVLVPVGYYGQQDQPSELAAIQSFRNGAGLMKKSAESLQTTRGVFMHFG